MAVGSNGNILRWSKSNNNDQLFTLVPDWAAAKPDLPEVTAAPGEIPAPPELTSYDTSSLPTETAKVIVGASLVLATMVDDIAYSDKVEQMKNVPYYIATREQHWSRVGEHGYSYEHSQGETKTISRTVIYEVSQRSTSSTEETWGTKFSINAEVSVSGNKGPASGTASAGMAAEFTHQLKISQVNESKVLSRSEVKIERVYDKSTPRFSIVGWSLIDTYTLRTPDGDVVSEAEAGYNNSLISKAYPRNLDVTLR
ncbi:MAG: hypothetical protein GY947_20085 [Rhodobacteraceae bacterium]|nr:hypothetical protein [Paracoccaceae bacterium]